MFRSFLTKLVLQFGDWITGGCFIQQLKISRKVVSNSETDLIKHQEEALKKLLKFVVKRIPFYRKDEDKYISNGMVELSTFPLIDKNFIKQNEQNLIYKDNHKKIYKLLTSGSSGTKGFVYVNKKELSLNRALQILWWEWAGYRLGDKVLQLGFDENRSRFKKIKDFLLRTDYHFAKNLDKAKILEILNKYQSKKNVTFFGYAAYLNWFAELAIKNNIKNIHFKTIISCGDKLFPHYRTNIYKAFGNVVYDTYGASEGFLLAGQRSCGKMHTYPQHLFIEILDESGNPVPNGTLGHVYVTCLTTRTMPMIRYKLGDLAAISDFQYCSCGISTPVLSQIIGRDTDVITGPFGGVFTVQDLVFALKNVAGLEGYQLIDEGENNFRLEYWPQEVKVEDMYLLNSLLRNKIQTEISISYLAVATPKSFSGKVQLMRKAYS
jgi:phenylacetate-CoA ligase